MNSLPLELFPGDIIKLIAEYASWVPMRAVCKRFSVILSLEYKEHVYESLKLAAGTYNSTRFIAVFKYYEPLFPVYFRKIQVGSFHISCTPIHELVIRGNPYYLQKVHESIHIPQNILEECVIIASYLDHYSIVLYLTHTYKIAPRWMFLAVGSDDIFDLINSVRKVTTLDYYECVHVDNTQVCRWIIKKHFKIVPDEVKDMINKKREIRRNVYDKIQNKYGVEFSMKPTPNGS